MLLGWLFSLALLLEKFSPSGGNLGRRGMTLISCTPASKMKRRAIWFLSRGWRTQDVMQAPGRSWLSTTRTLRPWPAGLHEPPVHHSAKAYLSACGFEHPRPGTPAYHDG